MKADRKVIIIGGNHHNTLGVIRSLGRKKVLPHVIVTSGGETSFVLKSKYIQKKWAVANSEAAIELLESEYRAEARRPVIIACHDIIASLIDTNREKLNPYFVLPGCEKEGQLTEMMDKKRMSELAAKNGLMVPPTFVLNSAIEKPQRVTFPCITKPVESRLGSKSEINVFQNETQLYLFLKKRKNKNFLIQQYIDKDFEFQLIGCSLYSGREVIIPGVSVILRQPSTTNTGFLHYRSLDRTFDITVNHTIDFIREIGYSGLFSVEFLRDKNGKDLFMEINYRNDGNAIAVTNAGVNLPYIWYLYGSGIDYVQEMRPIHDEYVMPEFMGIKLYVDGIINRRQWRNDMRKATSYMDYASDDPAPTNGWKNYDKQKKHAFIRRQLHKFKSMI